MQEFVQQCLDQGFREDEIEGLWQQYRQSQSRPQSTTVLQQASPAHPSAGRGKESSIASIQSYDEAMMRQAYMQSHKEAAEAKKKNSAGPSLLAHMQAEPDSRASSARQRAKESSGASVQSYDEAKSREAYLQGQIQALESKRKNAQGSSIF